MLAMLGVVLLGGLFLIACNKDHDNDHPNVPVAGIMAFNLAPDQSNIGIDLSGGGFIIAPIYYQSYTGGYLAAWPGQRNVRSYNYWNGTLLASSTAQLDTTQYYSIFVMGAKGNYRNVVTKDNVDSLQTDKGTALVRYVNAVPDSAALQINNGHGDQQLAFGGVSDFAAASAGNFTLNVSSSAGVSTSRTVSLTEGNIYTFLLSGIPNAKDSTAVQIKYIINGTGAVKPDTKSVNDTARAQNSL